MPCFMEAWWIITAAIIHGIVQLCLTGIGLEHEVHAAASGRILPRGQRAESSGDSYLAGIPPHQHEVHADAAAFPLAGSFQHCSFLYLSTEV